MNRWETVRHVVTVFGAVVDAATKRPVPGAQVAIHDMPPAFKKTLQMKSIQFGRHWDTMSQRPDRTITRNDGQFYFLDLPEGKYTLQATYPNTGRHYGQAEQTVHVLQDAKKKKVPIELALPPTVVKGKIVAAGQKAGVMMAEVRVKGSGERTFSDVQGQYLLTGMEPGKRTLMVFAQGYVAVAQAVSIPEPGTLETLNFNLAREGR